MRLFSDDTTKEIQTFFKDEWDAGFMEGTSGREYSGTTWVGYHGHCAGHKKWLTRRKKWLTDG